MNKRIMKRLAAAFILPLIIFTACEMATRDNPNDPGSSAYVRAVYVKMNGGLDSNTGSKESPLKTIAAGIAMAKVVFPDDPSQVRVAEGTYSVNWNANTGRIIMEEGVSLYGGYSGDFSSRDHDAYLSVINDTSTTGGAAWDNPNRAIYCGSTITGSTVIDGFTINGGGGTNAVAIFCDTGAAPVISNNKINGGSQGNGYTYGIVIKSSSPVITGNDIHGGDGSASADSYAVYCDGSTGGTAAPSIRFNRIDGGTGATSYGIINQNTSDYILYNNLIFGGRGNSYTYAIYNDTSSVKIYNNTIDGGYPGSGTPTGVYCIYIGGTNSTYIDNNILVVEIQKGTNSIENGIFQANSSTAAKSIRNNSFFNFRQAFYRDNAGNLRLTTVTINTPAYTFASGNASYDPLFATPMISTISWFSTDLHLTSGSSSDLKWGGLNGSAEGWGFTDDIEGSARTNIITGTPGNANAAGWSMGAYEF